MSSWSDISCSRRATYCTANWLRSGGFHFVVTPLLSTGRCVFTCEVQSGRAFADERACGGLLRRSMGRESRLIVD
jgi:hypothetical protein